MNKYNPLKAIFNESILILDKNINKFLFHLLSKIFLQSGSYLSDKYNICNHIQIINEKIIKKEENYINIDYSIENFKNIINFVKNQNRVYAGEIIEGLLIIIFSYAYKERKISFEKYIYNNLSTIRNTSSYDLAEFFKNNKFRPSELRNIEKLLTKEYNIQNNFYQYLESSPFFFLLFTINKEKYNKIFNANKNNKAMNYINKGIFDSLKNINKIYNYSLESYSKTIYEEDNIKNSISYLISNVYYSKEFGNIPNFHIGLIRQFLIIVFIYCQNKNSHLMDYIQTKNSLKNDINKKELSDVPFEYNLNGVYGEGRCSNIFLSPVMVEPRITKLSFSRNNIRECGLYDLSKVVLFNKHIKSINYSFSIIRTCYLDFINFGFGIFSNNTVEKLDLSHNYLKEDCEHYLTKLIINFKGLKTLNLTGNEIKKGFSSFFITLKKLYRKGKTKLENLIINKCLLDDTSFYELGELLKSKYCKLKKLYLNFNKIPIDVNFLKKLKNNKSLTEIYLIKTDISNNDTNNIMKIISNTHIRHLYLYNNKIMNFNNCLRIIYRTKILKDNNTNKVDNKSFLINLDLSDNEFFNINTTHIKLLSKIINETTLNCLDISHILYGNNPEKLKKTKEKKNYMENVDELIQSLDEDKKNYKRVISELKFKEVDIKRLKNLEDETIFINLNDKIDEIIKDEKAKFSVYLKEKAKILMKEENIKSITEKINMSDKNRKIEIKKIEQKLFNYMKLKKSMIDIKQLEEERKTKKLILL